MDYTDAALHWFDQASDPALRAELADMIERKDADDLSDAFFQDLSFGTAGLRGIIGPGTNRMNIYTVGQATQGLADYLNSKGANGSPSVAIARDSRHKGEEFIERAACVLAANGIHVYLFPRIEPTPALSFAVRDLGCDAGICITASHNPAAYNGYKAYGPDGCQITSQAAQGISCAMKATDPFEQVKAMDFQDALDQGMVEWIGEDTLDRYIDAVLKCDVEYEENDTADLSFVYTPLCGTGLECMKRVFSALGLDKVHYVESQVDPNGDFPTCTYPNPEERAALEEGIRHCERIGADMLLATDPDADRIGTAVRHGASYELLTGNEMGILLLDYLCAMRSAHGTMPENPIAVSTIVSTEMIDAIAADYGVEIRRTLTGFKYIGDLISELEANGEEDRFIFGFEESYGYLSGAHVRDKDAINAGLLICQMARHYARQGTDLVSALERLYEKHGYFANRTVSVAFPGSAGAQDMTKLMASLRANPPKSIGNHNIVRMFDYKDGLGNLPPADVVEFGLEGGGKVVFRPSGTEPKVKLYLFGHATSKADAHSMLDRLEEGARTLMG